MSDSGRYVNLADVLECIRARWQESERVPVSSVLNLIDTMPDCGETFYTQAAVDQAFNAGYLKATDTRCTCRAKCGDTPENTGGICKGLPGAAF